MQTIKIFIPSDSDIYFPEILLRKSDVLTEI